MEHILKGTKVHFVDMDNALVLNSKFKVIAYEHALTARLGS